MPVRLILGLGNPGERYRETRHNLGFRVVEELARRRELSLNLLECNSLIAEDANVVLVGPQTYMNRSGYAARCLRERRQIDAADMLVIYDDVWLELGKIRLRTQGGPGGHRGMESVIRNLGTESIPRLRLGVADPERSLQGDELEEYVLAPVEPSQVTTADEMVQIAADACEVWLREGADVAMNRFNS